jgi:hypothetical protein
MGPSGLIPPPFARGASAHASAARAVHVIFEPLAILYNLR